MSNWMHRFRSALTRDVVLFVRQSAHKQTVNNIGSQEWQQDQVKFLGAYGYAPERVTILKPAEGESGRAGADRPVFQQLLQLLESGQYGLLIVARGDRLGRNALETELLYQVAQRHEVLLMVAGRTYDPSDHGDKMMLGVMAQLAEYENKTRLRWMAVTRYALAARHAYPVLLPTGLTWGCPDDDDFVSALRSAGLGHWLDRLHEHKAVVRVRGRTWYVLPYPDAELVRSVELRLRWLAESGSLDEVVHRIETSPEWPHPGMYPVIRGSCWGRHMRVEWRKFRRARHLRAHLRRWVQSPALVGTYHFTSQMLRAGIDLLPGQESTIHLERAFPSFAPPEHGALISGILSERTREDARGAYEGPRNHLFADVRCAEPMPNGEPCGLRMVPTYLPGVPFRYTASGCCFKPTDHPTATIPGELDQCILAIVEGALQDGGIRATLAKLRADGQAALGLRKQVEQTIPDLEGRIEAAALREVSADRDGDATEAVFWAGRRKEWTSKLNIARRELEKLREEEEALRASVDADVDEIVALASNLPELIRRLKQDPPRLRALLRSIVRTVYVRRLTSYLVRIEVEFVRGQRITRDACTMSLRISQPELIWVRHLLGDGIPHQEIADKLNAAVPRRLTSWNAERVHTISLLPDAISAPGPTGRTYSIQALARLVGARESRVLTLAVMGRFGPAVIESGEIRVAPDRQMRARWLPGYGRREAAAARGWPLADTVPFAEVLKAKGCERTYLERYLDRRRGVSRDSDGALYCRRADLEPDGLVWVATALAEVGSEHAALDVSYWCTLMTAADRYPCVTRFRIRQVAPVFTPANRRSTWVWLGPDVAEQLAQLNEAIHSRRQATLAFKEV